MIMETKMVQKYIIQSISNKLFLKRGVWSQKTFKEPGFDDFVVKFDSLEEAQDFIDKNFKKIEQKDWVINSIEIEDPIESGTSLSTSDYEERIKDLEHIVGVMKTKVDRLEGILDSIIDKTYTGLD